MPPIPLTYRQVADDLAERVSRGELNPGDQIPSYAQLSDLYSVSVSTASRAVSLLRDRGIVYGIPGRGVFVKDTENEQG